METENTETTDEQRTTEESLRLADKLPYEGLFPCLKCSKVFKSAPALRMHTVRAHGKGWDTSGNFGRGGRRGGNSKETNEQRLARRRAYQKRLRARYYSQGKDSRGYPRPPGWKPGKGRKPRGSRGGNTGMKLPKWSPARLAKFRATMRAKAQANAKGRSQLALIPTGKGAKSRNRFQIVYPDPKDSELTRQQENERRIQDETGPVTVIPYLKFCPNCGEHLEGWRRS